MIGSGPQHGEHVMKHLNLNHAALTTFTVRHEANNEMDTLTNTSCLGSNWQPVAFTGQRCGTKGFHDGLDGINKTPVTPCDLRHGIETPDQQLQIHHTVTT